MKQRIKNVAKSYKPKLAKGKGVTVAHRATAIERASAWPNLTQKDFMKFWTNLEKPQEVSPSAIGLSISFFSLRPSVCVQPDWASILEKFMVVETTPKSTALPTKLGSLAKLDFIQEK